MDSPLDAPIAHPRDDARSVVELISVALAEPEEDTAWDAIFALRWRGTREVFERASGLCRSFCPVERKLGAHILGQLGLPERAFPKSCLYILLAILESERDRGVLNSILVALSHLKEPEAIGPAAKYRDHPDPDVRFGVVFAMMGHENSLAIEVLIGLTKDPEADNRDWACFALGTQIEIDTPELRDALAGRLADEDDDARCEAMVGLARRGDRRVVSPLLKALASESVRALEVEAASLIADPRLYPELVALRGWWDVDVGLLEGAIVACTSLPEVTARLGTASPARIEPI